MSLLALACLSFLLGPLLYALVQRFPKVMPALDGFIFISIAGLIVSHLLSGFGESVGAEVLVFLAIGLLGPSLLEHKFQLLQKQVHLATLGLSGLGFLLHSVIDGAALVTLAPHLEDGHGACSGFTLAAAVVIHRLPTGLTLWWLLRPRFGFLAAAVAVLFGLSATIAGYFGTQTFPLDELQDSLLWLQAFVAGSILHVVFFRFHLHGNSCPEQPGKASCCCATKEETASLTEEKTPLFSIEGFGNLLGLLLLTSFFMLEAEVDAGHAHSHAHSHNHSTEVWKVFYDLALESAPALLIAYFAGIFIFGFFPQGSVSWLKRGGRTAQAAKGMLVGLPLPVCSCGVLPYYQTLIKKGAPPAGAVAFLIATPELGLDALLLSFPLLGLELTLARLLASALVAFFIGIAISRYIERKTSLPVLEEQEELSSKGKFKRGLQFSLIDLVDTTAPWMLAGLALAALSTPLLNMHGIDLPWALEIPLFALIGLVVYVCASGATPLVAALIAGGISPGAALTFLLTGPATNISTFGVLSSLHGKAAAIRFAVLMTGSAMLVGFLCNLILGDVPVAWNLAENLEHSGHGAEGGLKKLALALVSLLFLSSLMRQGARKFFSHVWSHEH